MIKTITAGKGRGKVVLRAYIFESNSIVFIYNINPHIGAVAVGEYDIQSGRVSTSVITRLGHKDDVIARKAADLISKHTRMPCCVVAGLHLDNITGQEIQNLMENANTAVITLLSLLDANLEAR